MIWRYTYFQRSQQRLCWISYAGQTLSDQDTLHSCHQGHQSVQSAAHASCHPPVDYVETPDIDAVIVGVHYGTGRRGGQLAEWTLGLALGSRADGKPPTEFITFCRCC